MCLTFCLKIVWSRRFRGDTGNDCLVTVDGTDFQIAEHGRKFYSHKFKKSGLRYEICVCIKTGKVVWLNGPYLWGQWNDIKIFWDSLIHCLGRYKQVEANDGYIGEAPRHVKCPRSFVNARNTERMQSIVRQRQETANKRFKMWSCLKQVYRHDIAKHGDVFRAVCVITQLTIMNGEPLFEVEYDDWRDLPA